MILSVEQERPGVRDKYIAAELFTRSRTSYAAVRGTRSLSDIRNLLI